MTDQPNFWGTGVALVTPMKTDGTIDFDQLSRIIEHVITGGVEYIVSLGTTGEAVTLTTQECKQVVRFTVGEVKGRIPVVAGLFGSNWTAKLVQYVRDFDFSGIDGILSSSPAYTKPSQEGLFQHYAALARESPVPIILYNVPGRTGMNIAPETMFRLAKTHTNIVAVKEASASLDQIQKLTKHAPDHFTILSGDDPSVLSHMVHGVKGAISVIANAFPKTFSDMIRLGLDGKFADADVLHKQMQDIHSWLYVEGNPVGIKAALEYQGFGTRQVRLPLVPMSESNQAKLVAAIETSGLK
ncbi:MAG: 4-hydroxy-tetrahydrodipicolinate synthase [Saprospiraceae bacterium]|nr:4-hydroxy-tetrahydrodipicolinate synthase [Saprospiraceae bacterium]